MPKLIIDGLEIEVPGGTKVIDAAERLGIMIPRFCYHESLGAVGACRMCAVKFLQGPFKGIQMSCMIDAQDGMVVSTTDEEAVAFRRFIIECLMLNHPHDCPVCDEGGQCLLQDETVSGGHGVRRYPGSKRTYRDQFLGPFIAHEMNRCIHCYRCARFYQEFSGYRDLGVLQIASKVYFGRFEDGALESPFAGNLVDLCPTGVYTDKPSRFRARYWDMERSASVCAHCSLGCGTTVSARYREVLRVEARFSHAVNGHFICDRGRYGFSFTDHPDRPRQARIQGQTAALPDALDAARTELVRIEERHGKGAIAGVGSGRSGMETLIGLRRLCDTRGWLPPALFMDRVVQAAVTAAVLHQTPETAVSLRELEEADCIVLVGVDPLSEAPMLALALRQAQRRGARVLVIDPRPIRLPFETIHLPLPSADLERSFTHLLHAGLSEPVGEEEDALRESRFPVIVCGASVVPPAVILRAAHAADKLREGKGKAGFFAVLPEANSYAAALLGGAKSFLDILSEIEAGSVRGLLVVEADLSRAPVDPVRLESALGRLETLIVLDHLPTPTARRAHLFIPTTTCFETATTFVSQEGRVQLAQPVHAGGLPIRQGSGGSHPPREYGRPVPGSEPRPAGEILADLAGDGEPSSEVDSLIERLVAAPSGRRIAAPARVPHATVPGAPSEVGSPVNAPAPGCLVPLLVDWTFGTEELSSYSTVLEPAEQAPHLTVHEEDAAAAEIADGDHAPIALANTTIRLPVRVCSNMTRGILIVPRHRRVPWREIVSFPGGIRLERAEKTGP